MLDIKSEVEGYTGQKINLEKYLRPDRKRCQS